MILDKNQDKPIVTHCVEYQPPPSLPRRITHPSLPKGKELVTQNIVISPHLASPEGEGQILLLSDYQKAINSKSNLHLPYGGEREGADVHWLN